MPPNRGLPGRREGGGTRGYWSSETHPLNATSLTALVPQQNFGTTTAAYPTVFAYVAPAYAEQAVLSEFILSDDQGNELYHAVYRPSDTSGIVRISLEGTTNLPPLEVGKDYNWSFALVCDESDRSADLVVDSWIQRITATPALTAELHRTQDPTTLLASEGIWYDAIAYLSDADATSEPWRSLLHSVGLDALSPLILAAPLRLQQPEL